MGWKFLDDFLDEDDEELLSDFLSDARGFMRSTVNSFTAGTTMPLTWASSARYFTQMNKAISDEPRHVRAGYEIGKVLAVPFVVGQVGLVVSSAFIGNPILPGIYLCSNGVDALSGGDLYFNPQKAKKTL